MFDPEDKNLRESIKDLDELSANTLFVLAGLHALAGLIHDFALRDSSLRCTDPRKALSTS